jgi:hypothetical protein
VLVAALSLRALHRLDDELAAPARQVALLRELPAFALLPPLQLERLALRLRRLDLTGGDVVARQGEPGTTWLLIEDGHLAVEVDGRPVRDLGPGEGFGETALRRDGLRTATVTASEPSVLWSLDGDVFLAALRADDGRALAALDAIAQENLRRAAPHPYRRGPCVIVRCQGTAADLGVVRSCLPPHSSLTDRREARCTGSPRTTPRCLHDRHGGSANLTSPKPGQADNAYDMRGTAPTRLRERRSPPSRSRRRRRGRASPLTRPQQVVACVSELCRLRVGQPEIDVGKHLPARQRVRQRGLVG